MSGHSHFKTVAATKNANDAKKGKIFSKLGRVITIVAKEKGGDKNNNIPNGGFPFITECNDFEKKRDKDKTFNKNSEVIKNKERHKTEIVNTLSIKDIMSSRRDIIPFEL